MEDIKTLKKDGQRHLKIGGGLGVLSIGAIAAFGAIACPFCVIGAPAFVCSGIIKLKKAKKAQEFEDNLA